LSIKTFMGYLKPQMLISVSYSRDV